MSRTPSHPLDPTWLSIPFAKFSHNSSPYGTRNFTWNHVGARNDLDFILRHTRVADENGNFHMRILMKINAGAEQLELQDLGELVQHLRTFDPSTAGENPVQVVIKPPFLAMRYPKSGNVVRRIQLKFHNDSDFAKVLNFVKDLGLPITEAPTVPSISRPSVSPSPSSLSATSASTSLTVPSMLSAPPVSSSATRISLPTPGSSLPPSIRRNTVDKLYELTPDASSIPEFKVPMRPNSSFSEAKRPTSALPYTAPQISRPTTTSNCFSSPVSCSFTGLDLSHNSIRQSTSLYISQMESELPSRKLSHSVLPIMKSSQADSCPDLSLFQSQRSSQDRSLSERAQCPERQLTESPFFEPQDRSPEKGESTTRERSTSIHIYDRQDSDPQTLTSDAFGAGEGLNLWVPPKRILPFPKLREVSMQRSASISDLPALPKPTPISRPGSANLPTKPPTPVPKPTKKRVAQRKPPVVKISEIARSPPLEKGGNADAAASQTMPQDEPSPLAAKSAAATPRPASASSALQSKAAPKKRAAPARPTSASKRPKMVDQATQTQTLSGRDHTSALLSFRNEEPPPPIAAPTPCSTPAPPPQAPPPPPESYLDAVDAFVTKHKARPPLQELWERPGYAEADVEQRHLLLNNFICENLENKDFLQLCEDTANAWRRIGLGI